ncbi:hypothetical protein L3X38_009258 [Prunus dulcis]|uniref:Uncharacterized protein n=1 Tax=Prunus dulcis TaxID=3755 RepID=A0AAD4ZY10_PRUDU|nr:hypothetical protein L3X38_009258 [Prunus dulcis]
MELKRDQKMSTYPGRFLLLVGWTSDALLDRFGGETKENFKLEVRVASKEPPPENMVFRPAQGGPGVEVGQVVTATRRQTRWYPRRRSARPVVAGPSPRRRRFLDHIFFVTAPIRVYSLSTNSFRRTLHSGFAVLARAGERAFGALCSFGSCRRRSVCTQGVSSWFLILSQLGLPGIFFASSGNLHWSSTDRH